MSLRQQIEREIRDRGPIPFSRYMEICLYDPAAGYYSRNAEQFGKAGDFFTSSDVHAVFGRLLTRQFEEMWRTLACPPEIELLELGPGRGLVARDVLDWSRKKFTSFFAALTYTLQETSPTLRARLHETLREHIVSGRAAISEPKPSPEGAAEQSPGRKSEVGVANDQVPEGRQLSSHNQSPDVSSYEEEVEVHSPDVPAPEGRASLAHRFSAGKTADNAPVPEGRPNLAQRFSAGYRATDAQVPEGRPTHLLRSRPPATPLIVFANEFFDAQPVEILSTQGKLHLALENNRLHETWLPPSAQELEFLDHYGVHPELGERIEVPLIAQAWMQQIAQSISRGFLLIIDYGYTRAEQLAGRHRGTLMAYRQHSVSPNPYQAPGEQDLTAHVNFTALAAAAEQAGMQTQKLCTQSQFLMRIGEANQFADAFEDCRLPQERAKVALQLKHLVTPAGMGETFQVLLASRGVNEEKCERLPETSS
jgi:SAM-dependent MidA family methyltransferase